MTSLDALEKLRDPGSSGPGHGPARMPNAGGDPLAELKVRAAGLDAIQLTPKEATRILNYQGERVVGAAQEVVSAESFKSSTDKRLAVGSLIVQGLGMYWGIKQLIDAYAGDGPEAQKKRHDAWLSVGDSTSGLATGFLELAHAGNSMRLVGQGGMAAMEASALLPVLKLGAALAGVGGGIVTTLIGMHELTPLEKWANRSYFGKGGRAAKFTDGKQEQTQLDEALAPPEPVNLPTPVPYPTPAYDPRQQGPVQRKSS